MKLDDAIVDSLVEGRVEPRIYAFDTNTIPNYLKVGDTYRSVSVRLAEWREHYPDLVQRFDASAKVSDDFFFRDYAVHSYLEGSLALPRATADTFPSGFHVSKEFFHGATSSDVAAAVSDIRADFAAGATRYDFYRTDTRLPVHVKLPSVGLLKPRPNQQDAIDRFKKAVGKGRKNLLMYAVMRFGKSFTSMCCAKEMNARLVVVVSAKADVRDEWRKTVEQPDNFRNDYHFYSSEDLARNPSCVSTLLRKRGRAVVFLTLQDLQGSDVKEKHKVLLAEKVDLLVVDETHFGARAESFGAVLRATKDALSKSEKNDGTDPAAAADAVKEFRSVRVTLHLSGTPYRILMGSEFSKDDIVSFCQFTDIAREKEQWDKENVLRDDIEEWDNPYYGFPQMLRFALNPSAEARERLATLRKGGETYAFSALFKPVSIAKARNGDHRRFVFEREILEILETIDGSREDDELFSFLDHSSFKHGMMCRHMVFVLPYCASCDALAALIGANSSRFKNLGGYRILNISGHDCPKALETVSGVQAAVKSAEAGGDKTITLTVNRMLTGSTVPEWDTMLYFKDTSSPQEYDQAIFRLQNQYVVEMRNSGRSDVIRFNKKPQTLLVDFDPGRLFRLQEQKSKIYNVNEDRGGNSRLRDRIAEELRLSPVVAVNANNLVRVEAADIMAAVSNYSASRGVSDAAKNLEVDLAALQKDADLLAAIDRENPIGSRAGLTIAPHVGPHTPVQTTRSVTGTTGTSGGSGDGGDDGSSGGQDEEASRLRELEDKIRSYYSRILFFSFLTEDAVVSVDDILAAIPRSKANRRIADHVGIDKAVLKAIAKYFNRFILSDLDYEIDNLSKLSRDTSLTPVERARRMIGKFDRFGPSEVVTPEAVADEMLAAIPDDVFATLLDGKGLFLDIAGKCGEFAAAIVRRAKSLRPECDLSQRICTIPTSWHAYEFTRKVYEALGLDTANLASFTVDDLLGKIKSNDANVVAAILDQRKPFGKITMDDTPTARTHRRFALVVGNPPYQLEGMNEGDRDPPIYHIIMDVAYTIAPRASFVTPGRFLFNAGQTPKVWNRKMLGDEHLKVVKYNPKSNAVFPNVDIKGGVAITYRDESVSPGPIGTFTSFAELNDILRTVLDKEKGRPMFDSIVSSQGIFRFSAQFLTDNPTIAAELANKGTGTKIVSAEFNSMPSVFLSSKPSVGNYVELVGRLNNTRVSRFIRKDWLDESEYLDCYKVFVPEANGTGTIGEVLSTPIIGEPMIGTTDTFINIGRFSSKSEATACMKYVKTKFARTMLGILKATQHNTKSTWRYVPLQDFTSSSDIDWNKTIDDIDNALFEKYKLGDPERDFIKRMITPM